MIEKWLNEIENKFPKFVIDKSVIMPDHIHFIVFLTGDHTGSPLPKIVDWFKTMTTNEYIRGVRNGDYPPFNKRIWQRYYYEHIIRDEKDYNTKWNYIDTNPVRWGEDEL